MTMLNDMLSKHHTFNLLQNTLALAPGEYEWSSNSAVHECSEVDVDESGDVEL